MIPLLLQIKMMNLNQYHTGHPFEKDLTKKDEILTHLLIITEDLSKRLRKEKLKNIMVLCSKEIPIKQEKKEISSCSYVPAVGGLLIVNYLVNQVLKLSI